MTTKNWNDIKRQRPTSATARADAHLDNVAEDLGIPLAELRRFVDLTQVELAQLLLVTQLSVSEIERSESRAVPTVRRYAQALGAQLELTGVFDDGPRHPAGRLTHAWCASGEDSRATSRRNGDTTLCLPTATDGFSG